MKPACCITWRSRRLWASACLVEAIPGIILHPVVVQALVLARIRASSGAVNPLVGRLLEKAYWFYSYRYTITPVLLLVPVFALLGYAIPAVMYRQAAKQSVVEQLREAEV